MNALNAPDPATGRSGLPQAIGAYLIWGILPLYLILIRAVPSLEYVAWRVIWTVPLCLVIVAIRRQGPQLRAAFSQPKSLRTLLLTASLIGGNWLIYVWAIQAGHVYAASLGYYINPLMNVLLGTWVLGERLSRQQWLAVAIAGAGVALLLGGALTTLWISMSLALSFCAYGILRKRVDVGALPGLTVESILLLIPSVAVTAWYAASSQGSSFGNDIGLSFAISLSGVLTAVPLLLFAIAARRMDYSSLGFVQFLAPTIVFILGLTVFGEELQMVQLGSFVLIWIAIAVFVSDLVARRKQT